jgi:branched-chain amino acid transport system permease protein
MKKNSSLILYGIVVLVLLALPLVVTNDYDIHILVMIGIFSLLAIGFNLIFGYLGQLSLGHTAYYAIGAYASALAALKWGFSFWLGFLFAGVVTGICGFLIGVIALRWRSHFFVIATICFWGIIHLIIFNWISLTNGPVGLGNIPPPSLLGMEFSSKIHFYYLLLAFVLAALWLTKRFISSPIGRSFRAIHENEPLAESVGISAFRFAMLAFILSTVLAGIAGSISAHYISYISPEIAEFSVMITILVMVVLGGKGTLIGPVIGAAIIVFLQEYLRFTKEFRLPIFGLVLILGIVFLPRGIVTLPDIIASYWKRAK